MPPKKQNRESEQEQESEEEPEEKKEEYLEEIKQGISTIREGKNITGFLSSSQTTVSTYWEKNNIPTFSVSSLVYEDSDDSKVAHKGAIKKAHKFSTNHGTRTLKRYVNNNFTLDEYHRDIAVQRLSFLISLDFNKELREQELDQIEILHCAQQVKKEKIHDLDTLCVDGKYYYTDETWISGSFDKFVSNTGEPFVDNEYAHAFAHYSLFYSGGEFLICDIQGHERTFCDCQIATISGGITPADLGSDAMMVFMANHECNGVCDVLKLPNFKKKGSVNSCLDFTAYRNRSFEKNDEAVRTSAQLGIGGGDGEAAFRVNMHSKVPFYVERALDNNQRRIEELRVRGGLPANPFDPYRHSSGATHHVEDQSDNEEEDSEERTEPEQYDPPSSSLS